MDQLRKKVQMQLLRLSGQLYFIQDIETIKYVKSHIISASNLIKENQASTAPFPSTNSKEPANKLI